jgi:hypothetical protein
VSTAIPVVSTSPPGDGKTAACCNRRAGKFELVAVVPKTGASWARMKAKSPKPHTSRQELIILLSWQL